MILFQRRWVAPILAGDKTQTRRLGVRKRWTVGSVHAARTNMTVASTFAWLTIVDVRRERPRAITVADAHAEGFKTKRAFLEAWHDFGGDVEWCWVIEFVADESRPEGRPVDLAQRAR